MSSVLLSKSTNHVECTTEWNRVPLLVVKPTTTPLPLVKSRVYPLSSGDHYHLSKIPSKVSSSSTTPFRGTTTTTGHYHG